MLTRHSQQIKSHCVPRSRPTSFALLPCRQAGGNVHLRPAGASAFNWPRAQLYECVCRQAAFHLVVASPVIQLSSSWWLSMFMLLLCGFSSIRTLPELVRPLSAVCLATWSGGESRKSKIITALSIQPASSGSRVAGPV